MNKTFKLLGFIALAVVIGFSIASCGDDDEDDGTSDPTSVTYNGTADGVVYKLEIKAAGKAVYSPKAGDTYTLTVTPAAGTAKTSTGTVTAAGNPLTLKPIGVTGTFTVTVDTSGAITNMSGTITFTDNTSQQAPTALTPPTPSNPGGGSLTWTAVSDSTFDDTSFPFDIAYGNNKFVATGRTISGSKMAYSADGITWTEAETGNTFGGIGANSTFVKTIAYGNNKFFAGGIIRDGNYGSGIIVYSADGTIWPNNVSRIIFGARLSDESDVNAIAYGDNKLVAGSNNGKMAYSSADGMTWTAVSDSTFDTSSIMAIAYGNNKFVAVGGGSKMAYSADGITWTAVANSTFDTSSTIMAIAYGNNRFVAVGADGKMAYSN